MIKYYPNDDGFSCQHGDFKKLCHDCFNVLRKDSEIDDLTKILRLLSS